MRYFIKNSGNKENEPENSDKTIIFSSSFIKYYFPFYAKKLVNSINSEIIDNTFNILCNKSQESFTAVINERLYMDVKSSDSFLGKDFYPFLVNIYNPESFIKNTSFRKYRSLLGLKRSVSDFKTFSKRTDIFLKENFDSTLDKIKSELSDLLLLSIKTSSYFSFLINSLPENIFTQNDFSHEDLIYVIENDREVKNFNFESNMMKLNILYSYLPDQDKRNFYRFNTDEFISSGTIMSEPLKNFMEKFGFMNSAKDFSENIFYEDYKNMKSEVINYKKNNRSLFQNPDYKKFSSGIPLSSGTIKKLIFIRTFREKTDYLFYNYYFLLRKVFINYGNLLVNENIIDSPEDIFYCGIKELKNINREMISENKKNYLSAKNTDSEESIYK